MGNTCGCVDPAEKDAEVKVQNNTQKNEYRNQQRSNYRDSTLSKNYAGPVAGSQVTGGEVPQLFSTDEQYLRDLQQKAINEGL